MGKRGPFRGKGTKRIAATLSVFSLSAVALLPAQIATLSLGSASVPAGTSEVTIPITISTIADVAGGQPIAVLWATVRYDPDILGEVSIESARPSTSAVVRDQSLFVLPGMVGLSATYDRSAPEPGGPIPPSAELEVATLKFCVLDSAAVGTYPLDFIEGFTESGGDPFAHTRVKTAFGEIYPVGMESGTVTIELSSAPGPGCQPDVHHNPYPEVPSGSFRLGAASGLRGGEVVVPFFVLANTEVAGFQFSIDVDEEVLSFTSYEKVLALPDGSTDYFFEVVRSDSSNEVPGNSGIEEGFVSGSMVFSREGDTFLPRDVEREMLRFHFHIREGVAADRTEIRFLDGARLPGEVPRYNIVSAYLAPTYRVVPVKLGPTFVGIDSTIQIIGDVTVFLRGDSNGDDGVDLSDASATLGFLFLGGSPPRCLDAADANDDGVVNITDPILTLQYLFLGGFAVPPLIGFRGIDGTPDGLGCRGPRS